MHIEQVTNVVRFNAQSTLPKKTPLVSDPKPIVPIPFGTPTAAIAPRNIIPTLQALTEPNSAPPTTLKGFFDLADSLIIEDLPEKFFLFGGQSSNPNYPFAAVLFDRSQLVPQIAADSIDCNGAQDCQEQVKEYLRDIFVRLETSTDPENGRVDYTHQNNALTNTVRRYQDWLIVHTEGEKANGEKKDYYFAAHLERDKQ